MHYYDERVTISHRKKLWAAGILLACQGSRYLLVYWLPSIKDLQIAEQNTENQRSPKVPENAPAVSWASLTRASFPSQHCPACFPGTTSDLDSMTSTKHTATVHISKKSLSNVCFFFQFDSKRWLSTFCLGWLCQHIVFYQKRRLLAQYAPRAAISEPHSRKRHRPWPAPSRSEFPLSPASPVTSCGFSL